ncbi:MAG: hypothetical protein MJ213_04515 [Bacilli bacterium]|nr:hypothetical protein [Bacilli bacterium]
MKSKNQMLLISKYLMKEIDFLSMAGQGDALLMVDATTRISFHVSLKDIEKEESLILHKE